MNKVHIKDLNLVYSISFVLYRIGRGFCYLLHLKKVKVVLESSNALDRKKGM